MEDLVTIKSKGAAESITTSKVFSLSPRFRRFPLQMPLKMLVMPARQDLSSEPQFVASPGSDHMLTGFIIMVMMYSVLD
jgi:hypothetical protein